MQKIELTKEQVIKLMITYPSFKADISIQDDVRDIIFYDNNTLTWQAKNRAYMAGFKFKWSGITFGQLNIN